ncbi:carboxymuconolactone decarboxylase family protein [Solimicrobium silvestre]|uniref:Alkylhydroperoxidase AhpD family core domain n=1 Tax=Solimicrobium silvestre TaxID=2099400 RepID=A0A2S9H2R2_9BURK|nr:carboxymuconolactone decarboxylase family protein [Solimicrobium silvestre]PRC94272.1 Alkylhydroperoxidase AhpD family core domain [Solimicrobium silvestre]
MSNLRLPYNELSPELLKGFRQVKIELEKSPLGLPLIELVYMRISQINGCSYCLNLHGESLRKHDTPQRRINELAGWRVSVQFSAKEKAALQWTEALTHVSTTNAADAFYEPLKEHFSDVEISDLTFAISLMNAFNRLAIGMRQ